MRGILGIVAAAALLAVPPARAGEFDGWCFPGDGCTGDMLITDDAFSTCEQGCKLTLPTKVNDMQAMLYTVECQGDSETPSTFRLFLSQFEDSDGKAHVVGVDVGGFYELTRCEEG